jgi:hypothetical protein
MRRGLLAVLILLGGSSSAWAQVQFLAPPGLATKADTKVTATPDQVVSRLMAFDHNNDGQVTIRELSERMHPLVARGDRNGDGALDQLEVQALAVAPLSAAPAAQPGRIFGQAGGYSFGDDVGLSSRTHIEGALEDLRLASDKKERALPIVSAYVDTVEQAATADLIRQMEPLLSPQQLLTFTTDLNAEQRRQLMLKSDTGERRVVTLGHTIDVSSGFVMRARGDLARRVEAMQLGAPKDEQARQAIEQFKSRIRLGSEPERSALLAQLKDILSAEELDDYGAALGRRPVVASGPSFAAFNNVVMRSRVLNNVVQPAVLIQKTAVAPATVP